MHEDRSFNSHWQSHPDSHTDPACSQITVVTELHDTKSLTCTPLEFDIQRTEQHRDIFL